MQAKYQLVKDRILKKIRENILKPNTLIPSDRCIAEEFNVSMGTVKNAVLELVREGYLLRIQGKGTFVVDEQKRYRGQYFTMLRDDFNTVEQQYALNFFDIQQMNPDKRISNLLTLGKNQKVIRLRRIIVINDRKLALLISYFPYDKLKGLLKISPSDFDTHSIPAILEHFGVQRAANHELLSFCGLTKEVADILNVPEHTLVEKQQVILFDKQNNPYEYRIVFWVLNNLHLYREFHYSS